MESEQEIRERLKRLHGRRIDKEMGGMVPLEQARLLLNILEISHGYRDVKGVREDSEEMPSGEVIDRGTTECVDLSGLLDDVEGFDDA